uniref:Glucuronosyltransferase n=1 Tax=Rhabditophanes sp. KR3021 TaxID=114890 RepID=A0AC35U2Z9_9BILA
MRLICLILFSVVSIVLSKKILVYVPQVGASHDSFMARVGNILHLAGYNVTVLIIPIDSECVNQTKTLAHEIRLPLNNAFKGLDLNRKNDFETFMWTYNMKNPIAGYFMIKYLTNTMVKQCEIVANDQTLHSYITDQKFDLMLFDGFDSCGYGLSNSWEIPNHIVVSSGLFQSPYFDYLNMGGLQISSTPDNGAYFSSGGHSMMDRFINYYSSFISNRLVDINMHYEEAIFKARDGDKHVDFSKRIEDMAYYITNGEPLLDYAHTITGKVIELGGFTMEKFKELKDDEWDDLLNKRKWNVLISFGTVAKSSKMPLEYKNNILKAVKAMPYVSFIWKYEVEDGLGDELDNLYKFNKVPQNDLLNDPRLSLFVSHGGLGSLQESAYSGIPVIVIPLFGDQHRNAGILKKIGGKIFSKYDLSDFDKFIAAIGEIIDNIHLYKKRALKTKKLLLGKPFNSTKLFIKYIEYTLKFGTIPILNLTKPKNNYDIYFAISLLVSCAGILFFKKTKSFKSLKSNTKKNE